MHSYQSVITTYTWDSENRLARVDNSDGTNEQDFCALESPRGGEIAK